jgi:transposase
MLCWISIFGGLLIMMGQHDRSEALFYYFYFRLEDQIPESHLLRLIDKHISFEFVRLQLKDSYSETGRPSIDPELLLRILLIGYLYGITSERKLVEELRMHLAWRWFTGLGFDQDVPHHSTFSKNRHGRFEESKLFEQLFEQIVRQCVDVGLVQGQYLSVDGSFVEATRRSRSHCIAANLDLFANIGSAFTFVAVFRFWPPYGDLCFVTFVSSATVWDSFQQPHRKERDNSGVGRIVFDAKQYGEAIVALRSVVSNWRKTSFALIEAAR